MIWYYILYIILYIYYYNIYCIMCDMILLNHNGENWSQTAVPKNKPKKEGRTVSIVSTIVSIWMYWLVNTCYIHAKYTLIKFYFMGIIQLNWLGTGFLSKAPLSNSLGLRLRLTLHWEGFFLQMWQLQPTQSSGTHNVIESIFWHLISNR